MGLNIAGMDEALKRAVKAVGGATALTKLLNDAGFQITKSAISQWERCPVERVLAVETLTGVSRHELRPDIYPQEQVASQ